MSDLLRSIDQHYGRIYEIHPESNMHRINATNMVIHKVSTYSFQEPQQKFPLEENSPVFLLCNNSNIFEYIFCGIFKERGNKCTYYKAQTFW